MAMHTQNTNWARVSSYDKLYYGPYGWNNFHEIKSKIDLDFKKYEEANPLKFRHLMAGESFRNHRFLKCSFK